MTSNLVSPTEPISVTGSNNIISIRQQKVSEKVKLLELELKKKLGNNFNSVRKAFLELDQKHIGYITPEEIAKFLGASH